MRSPALILAGLLALPALAQALPADPAADAAAPAQVAVSFIKPEKFVDATYENRSDTRAQVTRDIAAYLAELGKRYLPEGQRVEIEITDIDLAGRYEPWQANNYDTRFMLDVTWPRINLKHRLIGAGGELAHGEESVSDMQYLMNPRARTSSDRLRYEKIMLDHWFRDRFGSGASTARTP